MSRECHYIARRIGHDTDELYAFWPSDGTLAKQSPSGEWEAVRGPDYLTIRAEIEHPERTLPPVQAD